MKVEIWSDVACPFCWIGKRHFEQAVEQLDLENLEIEWKSFELDPYAQKEYEDDLYTLLANKYGQAREWAIAACEDMETRGKNIGVEFNFDQIKSTNTFDAHRFLHLTKSKGLQIEAEEALFQAFFRDGKHLGDPEVLLQLGMDLGLDKNEVSKMLNSDQFAKEVRSDEQLGQEFGIRGVPFFVINRKYGISGAQPVQHFMDVLKKAKGEETVMIIDNSQEGDSCGIDGQC